MAAHCSICNAPFAKNANREIHEQWQHGIWHDRAKNGRRLLAWERPGMIAQLNAKFGSVKDLL